MSTPETKEIETVEAEAMPATTHDADLVPTMVTDVAHAKARLRELQQFVKEVMVEGEDYGTIPGTQKPTLYKPGAEKLCEIYGYAQHVEVVNRVEDWETPFFNYEIRCDLISKRTGRVVGSALGSCNSREARYRWRDARRKCPRCQAEAITKSKEEWGGGWFCFGKKGGCGEKFAANDPAIINQTTGRVENDDVYTLVNTLLKMAKKRAVVDATISVTRSSGLFTQDVEDMGDRREPEPAPATPPPAQPRTDDGTISDAQQKRLFARARAAGHANDAVKAWLVTRGYIRESTAEIRRADYDTIVKRLEYPSPLGSLAEDVPTDGAGAPEELPF